jgi:murein DD-endopeptidase MepM/ murein hydrolase activator NlpD
MTFRRLPLALIAFELALLTTGGCRSEAVREFLDNYTPHERYEQRLRDAGLDAIALGREWMAASERALADPLAVTAPYREESYFDTRRPVAAGYRVPLRRGQHLTVTFERPAEGYQVFLDLFRAPRDSNGTPRHLMSADSLGTSLAYLARRDGEYLVRIQPELLYGGRYAITIEIQPSLQFPVAGRDTTAIQSWYGDPRDGGRRQHEGLDIFARRGTPVVAAADGYVRSTRRNNLGGNVVWLRDRFDRTQYYAHLDSVAVVRGARVNAGDTIGFVGNSGNARTTPPHLHFGIYARGSFDPYPALAEVPTDPQVFTGDRALIGRFARTSRDGIRVRTRPDGSAPIADRLGRHAPIWIDAGVGSWYRVRLPDRSVGYVAAALTEKLDAPIRRQRLAAVADLLADPDSVAAVIERIGPGTEVAVLGEYGGYALTQGTSGRVGWIPLD